jgi:hypothetical protein
LMPWVEGGISMTVVLTSNGKAAALLTHGPEMASSAKEATRQMKAGMAIAMELTARG